MAAARAFAAGLLILEGSGLTESAGAGFINRPDNYKLGTVGLPFEGTEVRISEAGEVQFRSKCVMAGYHRMDEAAAEALSDDGWLSTGDQGSIDGDGFLTITGRIKKLFKTSGGKYIAPPAVEAKFATLCPYASQFMVFVEGRNFVALVALDSDAISGWAKEHGKKLNANLNRWETIKKWALLDHELSVETGELTPSLKVKRGVVAEQIKETLNAFYS